MKEGYFMDYITSTFIPSSKTTKKYQVSANIFSSISSWDSEQNGLQERTVRKQVSTKYNFSLV